MTKKAMDFIQEVSKDEAGRERLSKVSGIPELILMAKEQGLVLTPADFEPAKGEINEDELASVAGGGQCVCVAGGGGTPGPDVKTCACVGLGLGFNSKDQRRCFCFNIGTGDNY